MALNRQTFLEEELDVSRTRKHRGSCPAGRGAGRRRHHLYHGGRELFRGAAPQAPCPRLVALGARRRRGDLGPLFGLESRPRAGLRLDVLRHHHHRHHVSRPDLLARRDVAGPAAYGRRLFVRPHLHGSVGGLHHGHRREHRVRADAGRDRVLHRLVSLGDLRDGAGLPARLLDPVLRAVRRPQHRRRRAVVQGHGDASRCWRSRCSRSSTCRCCSPGSSTSRAGR